MATAKKQVLTIDKRDQHIRDLRDQYAVHGPAVLQAASNDDYTYVIVMSAAHERITVRKHGQLMTLDAATIPRGVRGRDGFWYTHMYRTDGGETWLLRPPTR